MIFKFNLLRCKEKIALKDHTGIIVRLERCDRERGHKGFHKCALLTWANTHDLSSRVENETKIF